MEQLLLFSEVEPRAKSQSQLDWIRTNLLSRGFITRNECLRNFISRLGARIADLKAEGLDIRAEFIRTTFGTDYRYVLGREMRHR